MVSVTVDCLANHPPIAVADNVATDEGTPLVIDVLANDYDQDGDVLRAVFASSSCHGTATINADGNITYTPSQNYCGPDSFTYTISDGQATATAKVIVSIGCMAELAREINSYIQGLADGAFRPPASERKNVFSDMLTTIGRSIENKDYQSAIDQLQNDVRIRTDGYLGGNPDDDWILNSKAQDQICDMIDELIDTLQSKSQPRVYPG
jgi:hypothetical protein